MGPLDSACASEVGSMLQGVQLWNAGDHRSISHSQHFWLLRGADTADSCLLLVADACTQCITWLQPFASLTALQVPSACWLWCWGSCRGTGGSLGHI